MAKRNKAVQALDGAAALAEVQTVVRRLIEDEDLREAVGHAIESTRRVYDRVSGTRKPSKLMGDKKLQADAAEAAQAIREVTVALTGVGKSLPLPGKAPKKKKKRRLRRLVLLGAVGGGAAVAASDSLRSKLLDALFGAEEEFQYSPPPPPAATDTPGSPLSAV